MKIERRYIAHELRVAKSDDGGEKIVGYAAKFAPNARSEDLGGFIEELHPNCFDRCLVGSPDVRALWNHDANHILGRTTAGTLKLGVDATGLHYEVTPPDTTTARDLMVSMKRGDVTQSSFGFMCTDDSWREDPISGQYIRTVLQAELFDVSPVTFPAYPDATSGVRSEVRAMSEGSQNKLKELRAATELRKATEAVAGTEPVATVEVAAAEVTEEVRAGKTKSVDGAELTPEDFAWVGDPTDPETWKLPIKFPSEEETINHIHAALGRFNQTEGIPEDKKKEVWDKIVAAAKAHGIKVSTDKESKSLVVEITYRYSNSPYIEGDGDGDGDVDDGSLDSNDDDSEDSDDEDRCECNCANCVTGEHERCSAEERCPMANRDDVDEMNSLRTSTEADEDADMLLELEYLMLKVNQV